MEMSSAPTKALYARLVDTKKLLVEIRGKKRATIAMRELAELVRLHQMPKLFNFVKINFVLDFTDGQIWCVEETQFTHTRDAVFPRFDFPTVDVTVGFTEDIISEALKQSSPIKVNSIISIIADYAVCYVNIKVFENYVTYSTKKDDEVVVGRGTFSVDYALKQSLFKKFQILRSMPGNFKKILSSVVGNIDPSAWLRQLFACRSLVSDDESDDFRFDRSDFLIGNDDLIGLNWPWKWSAEQKVWDYCDKEGFDAQKFMMDQAAVLFRKTLEMPQHCAVTGVDECVKLQTLIDEEKWTKAIL